MQCSRSISIQHTLEERQESIVDLQREAADDTELVEDTEAAFSREEKKTVSARRRFLSKMRAPLQH